MTAASKRRLCTIALVVYWLTLFALTHTPRAPDIPVEGGDKLVHTLAYAILALLACCCWAAYRTLGRRELWIIFFVVVAYAALDEVTQILVGRNGDWRDWLADVLGTACGMALYIASTRLLKRRTAN